MQVYVSTANAGAEAFQRGNYHESANNQQVPRVVSGLAIQIGREPLAHFHGYTSVWQEEYFVPSESDFQALEHIVRDWSESKLFRTVAAAISCWYFCAGNTGSPRNVRKWLHITARQSSLQIKLSTRRGKEKFLLQK
jgi:hypothetical protein